MDVSTSHRDSLVEIPDLPATRTQELQTGQWGKALKDIAFGSIGGVVGKFVEYPFDTVKVRLQSQPDGQPLRYTGPLDCFRQSFRQDGFLGLYRGVSAPVVGAAIETSSLFLSVGFSSQISFTPLMESSVPYSPGYPPVDNPLSDRTPSFQCAIDLWCHVWRIHLTPPHTN